METETLAALKASIEHWEENARAEYPREASIRSEDCALCQLCKDEDGTVQCRSCPVMARTGRHECRNTPYYSAQSALADWEWGAPKKNWDDAVQAEIDFLKSLLPEQGVA